MRAVPTNAGERAARRAVPGRSSTPSTSESPRPGQQRREGEEDLVDEPVCEERAEERRPALAQDPPAAALAQLVDDGGEVVAA